MRNAPSQIDSETQLRSQGTSAELALAHGWCGLLPVSKVLRKGAMEGEGSLANLSATTKFG